MKKIIAILAILVLVGFSVKGQSIIRSSYGAGGSSQSIHVNNKTYFISQSIGQVGVIGTSSNQGHTIRQGFQQPPGKIYVSQPLEGGDLKTMLYPNPFSQAVNISFKEKIKDKVSIRLFDISGRIILTKEYEPSQLIVLPLENIASGNYLINVASGEHTTTTAIIKK